MGMQGIRVSSIVSGAEHSLAATSEGVAYCWGWGRYGNIGDGETSDRCALTYRRTAMQGWWLAQLAAQQQ